MRLRKLYALKLKASLIRGGGKEKCVGANSHYCDKGYRPRVKSSFRYLPLVGLFAPPMGVNVPLIPVVHGRWPSLGELFCRGKVRTTFIRKF